MGWLSNQLQKLAGNFLASRPGQSTGPSYVDSLLTQKAPDKTRLLNEYRGVAYSCANLNAQAFASVPYRLFAVTRAGEPEVRSPHRGVSKRTSEWLGSQKSVSQKLIQSVNVEDVVEITSHPILDQLEAVNEEIDGFTLLEMTALYQEVVGTAYWYVEPGEDEMPESIWPVPPQNLTPVYGNEGLHHYDYVSGANKDRFEPEEIISFKFPNLHDPYGEGWSPIRAGWETIDILNKDTAYANVALGNQGRPDIALMPKEQVGPDEADRLEKRYERKFRRRGHGGLLVAESAMDLKTLNYTSREMEALARRGVSKEDIAGFFGVPISLLRTESVNRANAEAGHYQHARLAILPRLTRFFQRLNQRYCPMFSDRLFLWFDNPVPEDNAIKVQVRGAHLDRGVVTINEVRSEDGLEPVEWGDRPWLPATLMQAGTDSTEPTDGTSPTDTPMPMGDQKVKVDPAVVLNGAQVTAATAIITAVAEERLPRDSGIAQLEVMFNLSKPQAEAMMGTVGNGFSAPKPAPALPPGEAPPNPAKPGSVEEEEAKGVAFDLLVSFATKDISRTLAINLLRKQGLSFPEAYNATESGTEYVELQKHSPLPEWNDFGDRGWHFLGSDGGHKRALPRGRGLTSALVKVFSRQRREVLTGLKSERAAILKGRWDRSIDLSHWDHEMADAAAPELSTVLQESGKRTLARLRKRDLIRNFGAGNPKVAQTAKNLALKFSAETNKTTSQNLSKALAALRRDLAAGLVKPDVTSREVVKIVSKVFDEAEQYRAERIALTESSRALHAGQVLAAKESGVVTGLKWLTGSGACAECERIAAEHPEGIAVGGSFGKSGDGPYDEVPHPPAHPNCNCTMVEVIAEGESFDDQDKPTEGGYGYPEEL